MLKRPLLLPIITALALAGFAAPGLAQTGKQAVLSAPPGYDDRLLRLSEILGSLQYLRTLCGQENETVWRETMEKLLGSETEGEADRRAKFTAGYNRGYRAFASVYTSCSDAAIEAETKYRSEGESLTAEIVARYGN